jgi:chitin deacetylase
VVKEAKPGGIVLLHDGGGDRSNTVQALPQLIAQLKKHGYKFVTVPELLEIADKKLKESKG